VQKTIPLDKSIISFSEGPNGFFTLFQKGNLLAQNLCQKCFEPMFTKVASFNANQSPEDIYIGFINGTVISYNLKNNTSSLINSFDNRINRIIWAEKNKTLIIQEGLNRIILYELVENRYIRLFNSNFGQNINDLCLDTNGRLFILYDKNHLQWWNIDQSRMISDIKELRKTIVQK
jgi:hypothetical protein